MMAGSDFIKTSTGKETINATIPFGIVMCRAIRDYQRKTGYKVSLLITKYQNKFKCFHLQLIKKIIL